MLRLPAHLQRLPSGQFHFRIVVPADLRSYFCKREIKRSLKTCDRREAIKRARYLASCAQEAFDQVRSGVLMGRKNEPKMGLIGFERTLPDGTKEKTTFDLGPEAEMALAEKYLLERNAASPADELKRWIS